MKYKEITHTGVVSSIGNGVIFVTVEANSACAGCHSKGSCSMSEQSEKIIEVSASKHGTLSVGDSVTVVISRQAGIYSVALAYLVPVVLIVASLWALTELGYSELVAFGFMIGVTALYYVILYLLRKTILNRINIKIKI